MQPNEHPAFWGELSACDHLVQLYRDDAEFIKSLARFVGGGVQSNESVIVIATQAHRTALHTRLAGKGIDLDLAASGGRYIAADAEETLAKFMVGGWPDETRFFEVVSALLNRARQRGRGVRAFGELVAILWAQGRNGATVRLEHLWNEFLAKEKFPLFCAYPRSGFTHGPEASIQRICAAHSKLIDTESPAFDFQFAPGR